MKNKGKFRLTKSVRGLLWLILSLSIIWAYFSFHSYRTLTYMDHGLEWSWIDNRLISFNNFATQSARETQSKQLIYRQVDVTQHFSVFLHTTNNGHFLFTFEKEAPCSTAYQAQLRVNEEPNKIVSFSCKSANTIVYRIGKPIFSQLSLIASDFNFNLDLAQWDLEALKVDDFKQHNHRFFQRRSNETVFPWERD